MSSWACLSNNTSNEHTLRNTGAGAGYLFAAFTIQFSQQSPELGTISALASQRTVRPKKTKQLIDSVKIGRSHNSNSGSLGSEPTLQPLSHIYHQKGKILTKITKQTQNKTNVTEADWNGTHWRWGSPGPPQRGSQGTITLSCLASPFTMEVYLCVGFDIEKKKKIL